MLGFAIPKNAPYVLALLLIIGAFFFGRSTGQDNERVVYQTKVIQAGERHAGVEKKQSTWDSRRHSVNHIEWLYEGTF